MVSNVVSPSKDKSRSGKKKYKKDALEFVDYEHEYKNDPKFKTELCKTFTDTGFCTYGNKCRFAHGREELFNKYSSHPKYRKSDCVTFHTNGYCNYGSRCHFRHHEKRSLDEISRSFFTYGLFVLPKIKTVRLQIFKDITDSGSKVYQNNKNMPLNGYLNNLKRMINFNLNGNRPKNFTPTQKQILNNRKSSGSSFNSKSPLNSTISPEESIVISKSINRKLNFNDFELLSLY